MLAGSKQLQSVGNPVKSRVRQDEQPRLPTSSDDHPESQLLLPAASTSSAMALSLRRLQEEIKFTFTLDNFIIDKVLCGLTQSFKKLGCGRCAVTRAGRYLPVEARDSPGSMWLPNLNSLMFTTFIDFKATVVTGTPARILIRICLLLERFLM